MAPLRSSRSSRSQTLAENNATTTNRTRTGQIDHDVFEGLPVRRWTRQPFSVSQTPKDGEGNNIKGPHDLPELPMPKDSNLLSPMSREMLRAARAGCRYIRPTAKYVDDEEKDAGDMDDSAEVPSSRERSFTARKWSTIPRHVEPPEVEFLAKRRPGLPSLYGGTTLNADSTDNTGANAPPLRKTKIKKVDATSGVATIYEVWIPEGHTLEGEVQESGEPGTETNEGIMIQPTPAPGTVVEGVGVVNAQGNLVVGVNANSGPPPVKRRPPPPKRKGKGFGNRGRRKKVMFAHGESAEQASAGATAEGNAPVAGEAKPAAAAPEENPGANQMAVDSAAATPDNRAAGEEEEEESGEEFEEGEEGEEVEESEGIAEDTKPSANTAINAQSSTPGNAEANSAPQPHSGQDISEQTSQAPSRDQSSSPDLPLATASANRKLSMDRSPVKETHPRPEQQQQQEQLPNPPAENAAPLNSPPVPPTGAESDTHVPPHPDSNTQPEPEADKPKPSPPAPEPVAEANANPPDEMEGVVHHSPPTVSPPVPEQQQASEPAQEKSTTPTEQNQESDVNHPGDSVPAPAAPVHFEDGEVDLLGSLEASLEKGGNPGGPSGEPKDEEGNTLAAEAEEQKGEKQEGSEEKSEEAKEIKEES